MAALVSAALLPACGTAQLSPAALTTSSAAVSTSKVQLASVRAQDAETAAQIAANGRLLYSADTRKANWGDYCKGSARLAEMGNFREAVREASMAFFLGQTSGNSLAMAHASRNLAFAYGLAGDLDHARRWSEAAIRYARRVSSTRDTGYIVGPAHKIIGDVEFRRGNPSNALASYQTSLAVMPADWKSMVHLSMANAEIANRNFSQAREHLRDAEKGAPRERVPYIRRGEAELALAEGNLADALRLYQAGAAVTGDDYSRMWALRGVGRVQMQLKQPKAAADSYRKALEIGTGLRARFHSEEFKTGFFGELQSIYDEAVGLLVDAGLIVEALEASEQGRARAMLDLIRGRVNVAGAGSGNATADPVGQAQTVARMQAALVPKEALVVYHILGKRTLVWTVTKSGVKVASLKAGRAEIAQKVRRFRGLIEKKAPATASAATELHALLVAPAKLADGERAIFVAHKSLHLLPFQALRGPKGWLVQERAVSVAPSASALVALRQREGDVQTNLLALGNPASTGGEPPLPAAESEVAKISTLVKSAETFIGKDATKDRFMSRAPASGIVHIAAHSAVDELDPLHSVVRLAPSPSGGGDLEAHEVYRLRLQATRMVVLSSCDSGSGRVSAGDEFWGFQRTFLGAGARTLLVSQWPVYDDSTAKLMERFYFHLQKDAPAEALRKAQLELIQSAPHAAPAHWASFMVVGLPT